MKKTLLIPLLCMLALAACNSQEDKDEESYNEGYDAGHAAGVQEVCHAIHDPSGLSICN